MSEDVTSAEGRSERVRALIASKSEIHLQRWGGVGDVLLCTPVLRELRRAAPKSRIVFYTKSKRLLEGLPFIDEVSDHEPPKPNDLIFMGYEHVKSPRAHLAKIIAESMGLTLSDVRPECRVNKALAKRCRGKLERLPAPYIAVQRWPGPWTPNKSWPEAYWETLIDELLKGATIIEVGDAESEGRPRSGPYLDLRGKTSLDELVATIAAADIMVGPVSGPTHIAAAVGTPSVRIVGGYEPFECTEYEDSLSIYGIPECSPCWLREPCPIDRACLSAIAPSTVLATIERLLELHGLPPASRQGPKKA